MARTHLVLILLLLMPAASSFAQGSGCATATAVIAGNGANAAMTNTVTVHYWKITIPRDGYLLVQINSEAALDVNAAIFDAMPDTLNALSNDSRGGPFSEVWGLLKPGTYFVKVWRVNGTGTYTMSTSFTAPPHPSDPEPNNTPAFASPLNANAAATGTIGFFGNRSGDNEDYWKIKVTEDGYLRIRIQADSIDLRGGDPYFQLDAEMYDTNRTSRISYDFRDGTYSEVWQFVRAGTYYAHVWLAGGRAASYQITSDFTPPPRPGDVDGNDSPQTATQAILSGTVSGRINYLCGGIFDTDDYWKFTLPSDGSIVIKLTSDSLDAVGVGVDLNLYVYEVNGTRLDRVTFDERYGTYSECTISMFGGRTFYVRVSKSFGHGASYSMYIDFTPCDKANDAEPNDWFGSANLLTLNTIRYGHLGFYGFGYNDTFDFWKITATSNDSLYVHITSDPSLEVNLGAWGADTSINSYLGLDNRAGIYSRIGIKATVGITYYFRVDRAWTLPSWYSIVATKTSYAAAVGEDRTAAAVPQTLALRQNYPNPFNPSTVICYDVPTQMNVKITVYSILGEEVADLVNTVQSPGSYRVQWNGKSSGGVDMPSGVYPVRLIAGNAQLVKKALLIR